jgi:Reverse transcriptase (RNA-dependent DNA polymerase)
MILVTYMEKYGVDYEDIFAPVANVNTVRLTCAIAASKGWKVYQDDAKTAFLHAPLENGKWIKLPDGKFIYINKALYGLKEAPREWFKTFREFMLAEGFHQSKVEPCLFFKGSMFVTLYVDDTLSTGEDEEVQCFREKLRKRFKCGKGGLADHYIGIQVEQTDMHISLNQKQYLLTKLEEFGKFLGSNQRFACATPLIPQFQNLLIEADESNETEPNFPYRRMVGALVYLMICTRLDISAAVSVVSKYLHNPKKIHCDMVRRIYRYLRGTVDYGLIFPKGQGTQLEGYCDSSFANLESYRSLSGH